MMLYLIIASLIFLLIHYRFYWKVSGGNRFQDTTPFFISHRGFKEVYPENTINAFKHAEEVGFHWIELDVDCPSETEALAGRVDPRLLRHCQRQTNNLLD